MTICVKPACQTTAGCTCGSQRRREAHEDGCRCQGCWALFRVDVIVPDALWDRIKPAGKAEGAGLLCGPCILARLEALGEFAAYFLATEPLGDG